MFSDGLSVSAAVQADTIAFAVFNKGGIAVGNREFVLQQAAASRHGGAGGFRTIGTIEK